MIRYVTTQDLWTIFIAIVHKMSNCLGEWGDKHYKMTINTLGHFPTPKTGTGSVYGQRQHGRWHTKDFDCCSQTHNGVWNFIPILRSQHTTAFKYVELGTTFHWNSYLHYDASIFECSPLYLIMFLPWL